MLDDQNISLKAKGFIVYCLSKKEDWVFHISYLSNVLKEGEKAIYSVIDECIKYGYAIRFQVRKHNGDFGSWETVVSDCQEEIAMLKEEMKNDPDFQKRFTNRHFGDAIVGDPQNGPPSNTVASLSNTNEQQPIAPSGIVVYSILEKLDIELPLRVKISSSYSEEEVTIAVHRCLNWKSRNSDQQGIMTALAKADTWVDNPTKHQQEEINLSYLKTLSKLDGMTIGNTNIVVGNKYIEFTSGMKVVTYSIDQDSFKNSVRDYIKYLEDLVRYQKD
jgi:hypothetical protein